MTHRDRLLALCFVALPACGSADPSAPRSDEVDGAAADGGAIVVDQGDGSARDGDEAAAADSSSGQAEGSTPDAAADAAAPPAITTPNETAGTRLKPRYARWDFPGDGAEWLEFRDFFDTQRGEGCSAQTLSDGQLHCAPSGERMNFTPQTFFADAACAAQPVIGTIRSVQAQSCGGVTLPASPNRYFALPTSSSCDPTQLVAFPTTPPLAVTTIYEKSGSTCTAVAVNSTPDYAYEIYAAPPLPLVEVPPSAFVALTRTDSTLAGTTRLRTVQSRYTGADGSGYTEPVGVVDSQRNEFCGPTFAGDDTYRCMPGGDQMYDFGTFSDPGCSVPDVVVQTRTSCVSDVRDTGGSYLESYKGSSASSCQGALLYPQMTVGALGTDYYGKPSQCTAESLASDPTLLRYPASSVSAPLSLSSFTPASFAFTAVSNDQYGKPGSRMGFRSESVASPDGFSASYGVVPWDTIAGRVCYPQMLSDGNLHCVPVNVGSFDYDATRDNLFADSACTQGVFGVNSQQRDCSAFLGSPWTLYAEALSGNGCGAMQLYKLPATPLANPTLYSLVNGACTAQAGIPGEAFYRRIDAQPVSVSEFPLVSASVFTAP